MYIPMILLVNTTLLSQHKFLVKKSSWSTKFYINGNEISKERGEAIIAKDIQAFKLYKSSMKNFSTGNVLGFIGGGLIGWPIGTALGGGEPKWGLAAVGAGLTILSFPIYSNAKKKLNQSMDILNEKQIDLSFINCQSSIRIEFLTSPEKISLLMSF